MKFTGSIAFRPWLVKSKNVDDKSAYRNTTFQKLPDVVGNGNTRYLEPQWAQTFSKTLVSTQYVQKQWVVQFPREIFLPAAESADTLPPQTPPEPAPPSPNEAADVDHSNY